MKCTSRKTLLRYFAGTLTPDEANAVEFHAKECARCAAEKAEIEAVTRRLAPDPGEFDDPAFSSDVLTLLRLGREASQPDPDRRRWRLWYLAPITACVVSALLLIIFWIKPEVSSPTRDGFQIRGGADNLDRWVSISAFRSKGQGRMESVTDHLRASDAMAFTYRNRSKAFDHLMVLAVDSRGQIFWYYPAYVRPEENPASMAIRAGSPEFQMPDEIRHEFSPGPLRIFALFSTKELFVKDIEKQVRSDLARAGSLHALKRLSIADTGQHTLELTVD